MNSGSNFSTTEEQAAAAAKLIERRREVESYLRELIAEGWTAPANSPYHFTHPRDPQRQVIYNPTAVTLAMSPKQRIEFEVELAMQGLRAARAETLHAEHETER